MIICLILIAIAGFCNGVMDALYLRDDKSTFWNPKISWVRKWKNGDIKQGDSFFLSSTVLVWLTDGWHLMKTVMLLLLFGGIVMFYEPTTIKLNIIQNATVCKGIDAFGMLSLFCGVFELTFRNLRWKK